ELTLTAAPVARYHVVPLGLIPGGCSLLSRQAQRPPTVSHHLQLLFRELLDVDVLERDDPHRGHEPGRAVHIPHPGIAQLDLEVGAALLVASLHLDLVGQIETPLGLDHVAEHGEDGAVLLVQLELDLGFVPFEVFGAHRFALTASIVRTTRTTPWRPAIPAGWCAPPPCPRARGRRTGSPRNSRGCRPSPRCPPWAR